MATTATKKMAPATSASSRVNPLGSWTPGFIFLHLDRTIVEENDPSDERRLRRVADLDAVGEDNGARGHCHLAIQIEPYGEWGGLDDPCAGDHHQGGVGAPGKPVSVRILPVVDRVVDHVGGGGVLLDEDEGLVSIRPGS